jgi:hypothetical protein
MLLFDFLGQSRIMPIHFPYVGYGYLLSRLSERILIFAWWVKKLLLNLRSFIVLKSRQVQENRFGMFQLWNVLDRTKELHPDRLAIES